MGGIVEYGKGVWGIGGMSRVWIRCVGYGWGE